MKYLKLLERIDLSSSTLWTCQICLYLSHDEPSACGTRLYARFYSPNIGGPLVYDKKVKINFHPVESRIRFFKFFSFIQCPMPYEYQLCSVFKIINFVPIGLVFLIPLTAVCSEKKCTNAADWDIELNPLLSPTVVRGDHLYPNRDVCLDLHGPVRWLRFSYLFFVWSTDHSDPSSSHDLSRGTVERGSLSVNTRKNMFQLP